MIVDLPPSNRSARELVAREVAAFVGASLLYPFGIARARRRPTPRKAEQRTVVPGARISGQSLDAPAAACVPEAARHRAGAGVRLR